MRYRHSISSLGFALACAAAAIFAGGPAARAADAQAVPEAFDWSGFYAGVNAGYGWGTTDTHLTLVSQPFEYSQGLGNLIGGIQAGYNVQNGAFVFGVEADLQYFHDSSRINTVNNTTNFPDETSYDALGTARLRAGYAFSNTLVYATAGLAVAKVANSWRDVPLSMDFRKSDLLAGAAVGAGLEYAIDRHWSIKSEYLYAAFGERTAALPIHNATDNVKWRNDLQSVRLGLNYRF